MDGTVTRSDRLDRRKVVVGLGASALVHAVVIGWFTLHGVAGATAPELRVAADDAVPEDVIEIVRITAPVQVEAPTTVSATPSAAVEAPQPRPGAAVLARLMAGGEMALAADASSAPAMASVSATALSHVDGIDTDGLWDEHDAWAEGLVNRTGQRNSGVEDWFRALQNAAGPACGPTILINR